MQFNTFNALQVSMLGVQLYILKINIYTIYYYK